MRWFSVILGISITSVLRASTSTSILVSTGSKSWISKGKLSAFLQASFDASVCCNVLMTDDSSAIADVFDTFVKVYPYAYTVDNSSNNCPDYFLVSTSVDGLVTGMKTVPTTIASIRLLIVVLGDNVGASSGLFNVSMYGDVNVNIATHKGLWTLSENILNSRVLKKVYGFRKTAYKGTIMNFQGREVQAATVFDPPYSYLRSTINRTHNGVAAEFFTAHDQSELDGIEVQLLILIASRLNFTLTIRQGDSIDPYGKRNGSTWNGGMTGEICKKKIDIAFDAIFTGLDLHEVANVTQPWAQCSVTFAVPKPKLHRSFFALITPLSKEVWAGVLAVLVIQSIYVFGRAFIDPRISRRFRNFLVTFTELMGQLLGVWMPARMRGLRLQLYVWHLAGILLVTAYSSNLAARLARELYEDKIDTIEDLAKSNLTWGTSFVPHFENILNLTNPFENEIWNHYESETSEAETREKILQGNYAILGIVIDTVFFPISQVNDEDFQNFRVMRSALSSHNMGFVVQPWLVDPLDTVIASLRESGLVQYHIAHVVQRHVGGTQRELLIEKDDNEGPKVLKLTSLGVGFCILMLGLTLSTIVFFLELKYFNKELSPLEVLRQIKKNRAAWRIKERRRKRRYPFFGKFKEQETSFSYE